jgi:hypothetical protein
MNRGQYREEDGRLATSLSEGSRVRMGTSRYKGSISNQQEESGVHSRPRAERTNESTWRGGWRPLRIIPDSRFQIPACHLAVWNLSSFIFRYRRHDSEHIETRGSLCTSRGQVSATAHDSGRTGNGRGVVCRLKLQQSFSPSLYIRIPYDCLLMCF